MSVNQRWYNIALYCISRTEKVDINRPEHYEFWHRMYWRAIEKLEATA